MSLASLRAQALAFSRRPLVREGARETLPIALGIASWGLVAGVAMAKSGMGVPLSILMTLLVYAGSAQIAALPLIAADAPMWVVWATAICVNLRFVIQSAQWRPYLAHLPLRQRALMSYVAADLNYVLFMRRFPDPVPGPGQVPYFWGGSLMNFGAWHVMSIVGIVFASVIPTEWGFGFAGVLALLGLVCSLLVDRGTWIAAAVAGCAAVAAFALPFKLNIVVAIAAAVAIGLLIDHTTPRTPLPATDPT